MENKQKFRVLESRIFGCIAKNDKIIHFLALYEM